MVGRDDEQRLLPARQLVQMVEQLGDQRVGGPDLHAVQLELHPVLERVARGRRVADQLRGERRREPARRQHPRPVRQGDVDEVQRRFGGDRGDVLAEHGGLAERAAFVGAEPEPARVGVADVVAAATAALVLGAVGAPRVVDRRQAVAQRAGEQPVAVHDRGVLERLASAGAAAASAQRSGGHSDVTDS